MEYLQPFLNTETPFTLLFVALFFYVIKANKDREISQQKLIDKEMKKITTDMSILIEVWKILLEKEMEARKK